MIAFLQIVLRQYCDNCGDSPKSFLWDISKDFLLPIVLAGLAAYMLYFIFIKETKRDKTNESGRKLQEEIDKLTFLSALVESAFTAAIQQKNHIKGYIRKIREDDIDFHLMTWTPLYDLKRIVEANNLGEYLLAYANQYHADRKIAIKEFKEIVASMDYLHDTFRQILDQIQKSQMYDYERKKTLQSLFADAYNLIGPLMLKLEKIDADYSKTLLKLYKEFVDNHPGHNYDLNFYNDNFFIPFNDYCSEYLGSGRPVVQEILDIARLTRDGKQLFNQVKSENQILKNDLANDFKTVYRALLDLRGNSRRLLNDF